MVETQENPGGGSEQDLQKRLNRVEQLVNKNRELRGKIKVCVLSGSGILLLIVLILVYRVYALGREYQQYVTHLKADSLLEAISNPDTSLALSGHDNPAIDDAVKTVISEGKTRIPPAVKKMQKDVTERHLPEFRGLVLQEFQRRSGEFEDAGRQLAGNLRDHAETQVKDQLFSVMVESLAEAEEQLHEIFPELEGRKIEQVMVDIQPHFLDQLHAWGEMRVAQFAPVLRVIEQRAHQMTEDVEIPEAERAAMREEIFNDFLEGLIDRVKYELLPGLGAEIAAENMSAEKGGE